MMDKTKIAEHQHQLDERIRAFHSKDFLGLSQWHNNVDDRDSVVRVNPLNLNDENLLGEEDGDDVMESDEEYDDYDKQSTMDEEADEDPSDNEEVGFPERMQLMMPSAVHRVDAVGLGLEALMAQELDLRKGQANDALEKLRLALAHKSLLWRTKVQMANTTKKRTRAWSDIRRARHQIEKFIRCYHRARHALINLGADEETLSRYKRIEAAHLKVSGDIVEPSHLGQRNDSLAWFWTTGGHNQDQNSMWMQECESELAIFELGYNSEPCAVLVYRVNFLRAKARFDRWDEELKTVRHEMKWCVLYFRKQKKTWMSRTNMGGDGH